MPEDDYTGKRTESYEPWIEELVLFDQDEYEEPSRLVVAEDADEVLISVAAVVDGADSLQDMAERLYDLAADLLVLSDDGWETVGDVSGGSATAVRFLVDDQEDPEFEDG